MITKAVLVLDGISHEAPFVGLSHRGTLCGKVFISWVEDGATLGPWHGIKDPIPTRRRGGQVNCMACIVARVA